MHLKERGRAHGREKEKGERCNYNLKNKMKNKVGYERRQHETTEAHRVLTQEQGV